MYGPPPHHKGSTDRVIQVILNWRCFTSWLISVFFFSLWLWCKQCGYTVFEFDKIKSKKKKREVFFWCSAMRKVRGWKTAMDQTSTIAADSTVRSQDSSNSTESKETKVSKISDSTTRSSKDSSKPESCLESKHSKDALIDTSSRSQAQRHHHHHHHQNAMAQQQAAMQQHQQQQQQRAKMQETKDDFNVLMFTSCGQLLLGKFNGLDIVCFIEIYAVPRGRCKLEIVWCCKLPQFRSCVGIDRLIESREIFINANLFKTKNLMVLLINPESTICLTISW